MKKTLISLLFFLIPSIGIAHQQTTHPKPAIPADLQSGLNYIVKSVSPQANMGIIVQSVATGQVLYQYKSNELFKPASVNKLFVAIAALDYLKPEYRFETRLRTTGQISEGTLNGNLYVEFNGDPTLTDKQLINLLIELKTLGINRINGSVYVDNSAYGSAAYPPGWLLKDLIFGFAAPVNAVIINENRFAIILSPAKQNGYLSTSSSTVPDGVVHIDNHSVTSQKPNECPITVLSDNDNTYHITGCLVNQPKEQYFSLALRDPVKYAQVLIANTLRTNQIGFTGQVGVQSAPNNSVIVAIHTSPPLNLIVKTLLKESDNLYTNSLLKQIGRVYYKTQGTWQNGLSAVKQILGPSAHIDFNQIHLYDGSGLSLYNQVSPQQLANLLSYAYKKPTIAQDLWTALPIAGQDGTLRGRLIAFAKGEPIRAKTGSMKKEGVSALAGYIQSHYHGLLIFVIMTNGTENTFRTSKYNEDRICQFLLTAK